MPFDNIGADFGNPGEFGQPLYSALRDMALRMAVGGYYLLRTRLRAFEDMAKENSFNAEIERAMNDFRREQILQMNGEEEDGIGWRDIFAKYHTVETYGTDFTQGADPDVLPEPDIGVFYCRAFYSEQPYFLFEGKRLDDADAGLALEYVKSGIFRFADGRYARLWSHGGMLGYVVIGYASLSVAKINNAIIRQGWSPQEQLSQKADIDRFSSLYGSVHKRTTGDQIWLSHLILEF